MAKYYKREWKNGKWVYYYSDDEKSWKEQKMTSQAQRAAAVRREDEARLKAKKAEKAEKAKKAKKAKQAKKK